MENCGGSYRPPVAAVGAHQPFRQADQTQTCHLWASVNQFNMNLLDRGQRVHAPRDCDINIFTTVTDAGVALSMGHLKADGALLASGGGQAPRLPRQGVLQQEPFGGSVLHRVVGPRSQLIQTAIDRPGVSTAGLGNMGTQPGVGQYIDPGAQGALDCAHLKFEFPRFGLKFTLRRVDPLGAIRPFHQGGSRNTTAQFERLLMQATQFPDMKCEGTAIGLQGHPGQSVQRPELFTGQLVPAQHMKSRVHLGATRTAIGYVAVAKGDEIALQRHQITHGLRIDDDQITRHAPP